MIKIERFYTKSVPTDDEILEAIEYAKENNCMVEFFYQIAYSGKYTVLINKTDTLESVRAVMPKSYGV